VTKKKGDSANRILIVDDLLYNQEALKIFIDLSLGLGKSKEICDTAKNGIEAL